MVNFDAGRGEPQKEFTVFIFELKIRSLREEKWTDCLLLQRKLQTKVVSPSNPAIY